MQKSITDSYIFDILIENPSVGLSAIEIYKIIAINDSNIKPSAVGNRLVKLWRKKLLFRQKAPKYKTNPPYLYYLNEPL